MWAWTWISLDLINMLTIVPSLHRLLHGGHPPMCGGRWHHGLGYIIPPASSDPFRSYHFNHMTVEKLNSNDESNPIFMTRLWEFLLQSICWDIGNVLPRSSRRFLERLRLSNAESGYSWRTRAICCAKSLQKTISHNNKESVQRDITRLWANICRSLLPPLSKVLCLIHDILVTTQLKHRGGGEIVLWIQLFDNSSGFNGFSFHSVLPKYIKHLWNPAWVEEKREERRPNIQSCIKYNFEDYPWVLFQLWNWETACGLVYTQWKRGRRICDGKEVEQNGWPQSN